MFARDAWLREGSMNKQSCAECYQEDNTVLAKGEHKENGVRESKVMEVLDCRWGTDTIAHTWYLCVNQWRGRHTWEVHKGRIGGDLPWLS
eukprot:1161070-Pelagomonas_calceolata.AAC.7